MIERRISGYFQRSEVKTAVVRSQASGVFGFPAANRHHSRDGGFSEEDFLKKLPVSGPRMTFFLAIEIFTSYRGITYGHGIRWTSYKIGLKVADTLLLKI